jgi:hypothetical protein
MSLPLGSETQLSQNGARLVYNVALLAGENPALGGIGVYAAGCEYIAGSGVSDAADITLGTVGAAGDLLEEIVIRNTSATYAVTVTIKDSSTALDAYTEVVAAGGRTRIAVGLLSKNGAWKLNLDIAAGGTISEVKYLAAGAFS